MKYNFFPSMFVCLLMLVFAFCVGGCQTVPSSDIETNTAHTTDKVINSVVPVESLVRQVSNAGCEITSVKTMGGPKPIVVVHCKDKEALELELFGDENKQVE